ncbi:MAG: 4Fe-4S binding protein [Rhodanobacter sp.]
MAPIETVIAPASTAAPHGHARAAALAAFVAPQPVVQWVEYKSTGRLLIIGPADEAWPLSKALATSLDCAVLATRRPAEPPESAPPVRTAYGTVHSLTGHLGAFQLEVETEAGTLAANELVFGAGHPGYDLVLDIQAEPAIKRGVPPLGYHHAPDSAARERALRDLPDMVGEFEKPRFIDYNADICAHGERGLEGCHACIDACPAEAPFSVGERIEVDYNLCQGCGSCTVACPTGAITYATPPVGDLLGAVRRMLATYRAAGGTAPVIALHGDAYDAAVLEGLPAQVLPIRVEDIGSIGLDAFVTLLAYGAAQVRLLATDGTPSTLLDTTRGQIAIASVVLAGLGDADAERRILLLTETAAAQSADVPCALPGEPATFAVLGNKREIFRMALAHLQQHSPAMVERAALPANAPFGAITVNDDACTLCMACVSVCPASAVQGGGAEPKLWFREDSCVQCGLCEKACPENAIKLVPQIDFAAHLQPERRLLHQEIMQVCLGCGKPFTTHKMVVRMREKLQNHWMFKDPEAQKVLLMCEDCRIKAVFADNSPVHPHPK